MKLFTLLLIAALPLLAQAADLKPGVMTNPESYAAEFPLGTLTESDMLEKVGPPDRILDMAGKRLLVYQFGEGFGLRTWTYTIENGKVVEALYNDKGSYNGTSARKIQQNPSSTR